MNNKLKKCKVCGQDMAQNAVTCPHCGAKNKKPLWWIGPVIAVIVLIAIIAGSSGDNEETPETPNIPSNNVVDNTTTDNVTDVTTTNSSVNSTPKENVFSGDCGISASADVGESVIGYPQLNISITNTSEKEIAAIRFHVVPYDVYGEEISTWITQNELSTDTAIAAGASTEISYQFLENTVKTVKLYVYSVYFSDGTEWGNKDATDSTILKYAPQIEVIN